MFTLQTANKNVYVTDAQTGMFTLLTREENSIGLTGAGNSLTLLAVPAL